MVGRISEFIVDLLTVESKCLVLREGSSTIKDTLGDLCPHSVGHRLQLHDLLQLHKPLGPLFIETAKATLKERQGEADAKSTAKEHLARLVEISGSTSASASHITDAFCVFVCLFVFGSSLVRESS